MRAALSRRSFALGLAALVAPAACKQRSGPAPSGSATGAPRRVVSLAPALTDSLFAIGAGSSVVGVSDYCDYPPEATKLPRLGTSLTPNYEAIARLSPDLLVSEANAGARRKELEALAPTLLLPWLSLDDVTSSLITLGERVGKPAEAKRLSERLRARLGVPEPENGPRVLLVLGYEPGKLDEVWFVRVNSLHGAALRAAGGRNAVAAAVQGNPRISQERVLELDPDIVLILVAPQGQANAPRYLEDWRRLPSLSAVKNGRVRAVTAPEAFANGPRILDLADRLEREIRELRP